MKVIVAKTAGFCYGVERATRMAFEAVEKAARPIHSLGSIIHNPQVVAELDTAGVRVVETAEEIGQGTAIISAHGRAAAELDDLAARGVAIVDATCPHVRLPQKRIAELAREGCVVVLLGDRSHPEVRSVASYAGGARVIIVTDPGELPDLSGVAKVGIVAQTTQSKRRFEALVAALRAKVPEVIVHDTICSATRERQDEAEQLARTVDAMVVVGGNNSANTRRLAEIARVRCPRTWQIESAGELRSIELGDVDVIGVTAGASTPDRVIREVVEKLEK